MDTIKEQIGCMVSLNPTTKDITLIENPFD
jgi:hypothetical protein